MKAKLKLQVVIRISKGWERLSIFYNFPFSVLSIKLLRIPGYSKQLIPWHFGLLSLGFNVMICTYPRIYFIGQLFSVLG